MPKESQGLQSGLKDFTYLNVHVLNPLVLGRQCFLSSAQIEQGVPSKHLQHDLPLCARTQPSSLQTEVSLRLGGIRSYDIFPRRLSAIKGRSMLDSGKERGPCCAVQH